MQKKLKTDLFMERNKTNKMKIRIGSYDDKLIFSCLPL